MDANFTSLFIDSLPSDSKTENVPRKVLEACYSYVRPTPTAKPEWVIINEQLGAELGFGPDDLASEEFLKVMTGNRDFDGVKPYAMCYGGHQFGHWAGQLGDGRAINIGEVTNAGRRYVMQLKGAGPTPYSRSADGRAVLRSSIREYLCSEAMFHLGVPTTRALSLALTGDEVLRDVMYNGNSAYEKGAIVCRVSQSFIRFGNFEIFASRKDYKTLQELLDFTLTTHFPHLGPPSKESYIDFFQEVADRTLDMIIEWLRVGFVHGVMNTDNLSILGLTIDYGPYGWLEGFDFGWTPNTTDAQHKRYRFGNQANIGIWNLYQLANSLQPLIQDVEALNAVLKSYQKGYATKYLDMMRGKLGLSKKEEGDDELVKNLIKTLHLTETDMTIFFRSLTAYQGVVDHEELLSPIMNAFYEEDLDDEVEEKWKLWIQNYLDRLTKETNTPEQRTASMNAVNPKYVLRNYMAQLAIDQADKGDYTLVHELDLLIRKPYDEQPDMERWYAKRPEWARTKIGCSMLSCSS